MEDYKKLYEETQSKMKAFIKRWDGIKLSSNDLFTEELKQIVETENEDENEQKVIHKKTGNPYKIITDNFMFKQNGKWIKNLILYETLYDNPDGKFFARTKEDFEENFERETYDSVDSEICTSIEQSKKLRKLGIDTSTADMFWDTLFAKKPEAQVNNHHFIDEYDDEHRVPAWSLAALLKIIPYKINDNISDCVLLQSKRDNGYSISYVRAGNHYCAICSIFKHNILDAAFEMICWLLENNKL